ncbi:Acetyl-CoA hydrolase/transferase C-terminal domain containing protein [Desulfosarcina cetonica]|uniref:bifunctional acetyl-CoA hydrolase/transferase family protein/GNAT family N-acetyltransferase n=1 Tax=Desulfosarcina cetonica TaxID=90730 RepID=UPI0006D0B0C4|nr:bifunctional acetyl-CoA hydrolase/transferase family protein/GNAT family N-acetyltransferase [Desulfosarcina cetonica]VTR67865.1 Acetyl-CoA hydrolase/transferase C-terminal domain containing protein [Desulfosarcina cetonica]
MELEKACPEKLVDTNTALSKIKNGSRVFIGSGCGEPQHLIRTMVEDLSMQDTMLYQMLSWTFADYVDDREFMKRFSLKLFFISAHMRKAAFEGKIDYIPTYLSQIPRYFAKGHIALDVALIQVSPPDEFGYCSLGVSVDITLAGMQNAKLVIAQVNPRMPRTWGDSMVHINEIDYLVPFEEPLVETRPHFKNPQVAERIGYYVNQLVDDGATLQIGFGHLPNTILQQLSGKRDLGIHTQLITDAFLPLFEQNVITNRKKTLHPGKVLTSMCMGSEKLYRFIHDNPMFYFSSSEYVNDPTVIALNDNLISISSALEVDLTGQVCTDSMGHLFYSGIGDQVDFLRGSAMSKGGFSVIALPSTAQNGKVSRIVPHLSQGAGVATTRGDVNFVVTEYGIAELSGKSIYQRVMELAQIAHPQFREELIDVAKSRHYIFADQLPPSQDDLIFLERYKNQMTLKNGKTVEYRPLLPSDEFAYRNFYYSLQEKTIYYRFFYKMKVFSHEVVQKQWSSVDYRKNMSMIGLVRIGGYQEIIAIGSYADDSNGLAEVAFVVREDFQSMGIASHLLASMQQIAKENEFTGFSAMVLRENTAMLQVFKKRYPHAKASIRNGNEISILMDFSDAVEWGRKVTSDKPGEDDVCVCPASDA